MSEERRIVEFEKLNLLGKAVFLGGAATHLAVRLIDQGIDKAAELWVETERAFLEGRGDDIEDARIVDEQDRQIEG